MAKRNIRNPVLGTYRYRILEKWVECKVFINFFRQIFAILFADFSKMCTESAGELEIMKNHLIHIVWQKKLAQKELKKCLVKI